MLPLLISAVVVVAAVPLAALYKGPIGDNSTINTVESQLWHEEEIAEMKRKNDQGAEEIQQGKKRVQEMEARSQRREEELMRMMMQQVEIREQGAEVNTHRKAQDEDKRKWKKKGKRLAREKNKEESRETAAEGGSEEEARELEREIKELKMREKMLEEEVERVNRMADNQRATRVAEDGFGPLRWPTRAEFQQALDTTEYNNNNFHFAIVGRAGSGKSLLLNAFRNLANKAPGAPPACTTETGTTETTLEVTRYKGPGSQSPRQCTVWFKIPIAGTHQIPHHDYFIKQGLFVFDFIILAIGDRFEEIDACILENCKRFKIPAFIVRSNADMHILNLMKEYEYCKSINENPYLYKECRNRFIAKIQKSVSDGLKLQGLPDQHVYIVSSDELQWAYDTSLQFSGDIQALTTTEMRLIHESLLAKELLTAAAQRRCNSREQTTYWARAEYSAIRDYFRNTRLGSLGQTNAFRLLQESQPLRAIPRIVQDARQHDIRQDTSVRGGVIHRVAGAAGSIESTRHKPVQEATSSNPEKRKVIYPHQETSPQELYDEMAQHNPELSSKMIGLPCMFTPRVAMLTFYSFAPIPSHIYAFGSQLRVEEYRERKQQGKKSVGRSTHTHVDEAKPTASEGYQSSSTSTRGKENRGRGKG